MIVGVLISLAFAAVSYTFIERQSAMQKAGEAEGDELYVIGSATAPVRPVGQDMAGMPVPPRETEPPVIESKPTVEQQKSIDPELEARQRLLRRIEENRYAQLESALVAETDVQKFSNRATAPDGQAPTPGSGDYSNSGQKQDASHFVGLGGLGELGDADQNKQGHKRAFLSERPESAIYLSHTRMAPLSTLEVKAGTIVPGVMISGVNSDLPGQLIGQVRENVYDTATGRFVLIPAGARLIGTYDSTVTMGQERVLIAWTRIIYPDGSSVLLDRMPGADVSGFAGFTDKVDNHYWRIFGNAFMLSLFSAGIQLSQPTQPRGAGMYDSQQIMAAELGRQIGRLGMEMTRRNLNIQPTLEIRPGYNFTVMITKDIILPPWQGHPMAAVK